MRAIFKIGAVILVGVILFVVYPYINMLIGYYTNIEQSIYSSMGITMQPGEVIYWQALPLIALVLIFWIVWKIAVHKRQQ